MMTLSKLQNLSNPETRSRRLAALKSLKIEGDSRIDLALRYCMHYHKGQTRKGSRGPYHAHPIAVAQILMKHGYGDEITQCIALLHDTVEDSPLRMDEITKIFGFEIANGVYILSRNKGKIGKREKLSEEDYRKRLEFARNKIKRVKIADMIDNTRDLESLNPSGRIRKMHDAERFYIPMGMEICPEMTKELEMNIRNYRMEGRMNG